MSCCTTLSTVALIVINVFVSLLAIVFFIVGVAMTAAPVIMVTWVWPVLESALKTSSQQSGTGEYEALFDDEFTRHLHTLSIPMIVVSLVILVVSFFGCYGACCKNRCLLAIYSLIMTLIVLGVLAGCCVVYLKFDEVMPGIETRLGTLVKENYVNETNSDIVSLLFTLLQDQHGCCGSSNGGDYVGSNVLARRFPNQVIPISCCVEYETRSAAELLACTTITPEYGTITNYNFGCFDAFQKDLKTHFNYVLLAIAVSMIFIAILAILGWCLFAHAVRTAKADNKAV